MWKFNVVLNKDQELIKYTNQQDAIGGVIVGDSKYCYRQMADFSIDEIKQLVDNLEKTVIVNINKLFHNQELDGLRQYLQDLSNIGVHDIMVADLAIAQLVEELNLQFNIIYTTETTITNQYFTDFAKQCGIRGIELAKEITLDEVAEIVNNKKCQVGIAGHGQLYMYQSMRPLLTNYFELQQMEIDADKQYYLYDSERDVYYPIGETQEGTHILASNDVCMIHKLNDLVALDLDYVKLDGYLYKSSDYLTIIKLYIEALTLCQMDPDAYKIKARDYLKQIKNICQYKQFSTGFFYKKTVY